mgnify:CR=1 FL=1
MAAVIEAIAPVAARVYVLKPLRYIHKPATNTAPVASTTTMSTTASHIGRKNTSIRCLARFTTEAVNIQAAT